MTDVCVSCRTVQPEDEMERTPVAGYGTPWLCRNPTACRQRAQANGEWGKIPAPAPAGG